MSVAIMNMALDLLDEVPILTAEDDSAAIRFMRRNYQPVADSMLRLHPWNFAIRRSSLSRLADNPQSGYQYQFQLPADFIRLLPLSEGGTLNGTSLAFRREGSKILTNAGSPLTILYVARVSDESEMDPIFVQALATTLAARAASLVTGKNTLAKTLQDEARQLTIQAQMVDALEGTPYEPEADDWINARFGVEAAQPYQPPSSGTSGTTPGSDGGFTLDSGVLG